MVRFLGFTALVSWQMAAQSSSAPQQVVGVVIEAVNAQRVLAEGRGGPHPLYAGDLLFAGQTLRAYGGRASIADCGNRLTVELQGGSVSLATRTAWPSGAARGALLEDRFCETLRMAPDPDLRQQDLKEQAAKLLLPGWGPPPSDTDSAIVRKVDAELGPPRGDDKLFLLSRAAALEAKRQFSEAHTAYERFAAQVVGGRQLRSPRPAWISHKLTDLRYQHALKLACEQGRGKPQVAALVIGISDYQANPRTMGLLFARYDARAFAGYLGLLQDPRITPVSLRDKDATQARILAQLLALGHELRFGGTAIVFISAHGMRDVNTDDHIIPHDGYVGYLSISGVSLAHIALALRAVPRVYLFVDACRHTESPITMNLPELPPACPGSGVVRNRTFVLHSTQPGLKSDSPGKCDNQPPLLCGPGEGYGMFTFHLVRELMHAPGPGAITGMLLEDEIRKRYQAEKVRYWPEKAGNLEVYEPLDPLRPVRPRPLPPPKQRPNPLGPPRPSKRTAAVTWFVRPVALQQGPDRAEIERQVRAFKDSFRAGSLTAESARRALHALEEIEPGPDYEEAWTTLRVELEEAGQRILRRYLQGDEVPQLPADFEAAAGIYRVATQLSPESLMFESRARFFEARARLFLLTKTDDPTARAQVFRDVVAQLEEALRLDPSAAYILNALGIAHLEAADYRSAAARFEAAGRLQPGWAYPRHNLALTHMQMGCLQEAIAGYREAIASAPRYSYLHFNLGLLYQRLNRPREAQRELLEAKRVLDNLPGDRSEKYVQVYNALGALKSQTRNPRQAERYFNKALEWQSAAAKPIAVPELLHNLALLRRGEAKRGLLRRNIAANGYVPSRLELALELTRTGSTAELEEAARELEEVIRERRQYAGAYLEAAEVYRRLGRYPMALSRAAEAVSLEPQSWRPRLAQARILVSSGRLGEAEAARSLAVRLAGRNEKALREIRRTWNPN